MEIKDLIGFKTETILASGGAKSDFHKLARLYLVTEILATHLYYLYRVIIDGEVVYEGDDLATAVEVFNTK